MLAVRPLAAMARFEPVEVLRRGVGGDERIQLVR